MVDNEFFARLSRAIGPYLPTDDIPADRPFTTLTYAASLDSRIAARAGERTVISSLETKHMTHLIRQHHDALLVGVGTAIADDPKLNARGVVQASTHLIRPVIVDPELRWQFDDNSQMFKLARTKQGLGPWIIVRKGITLDEARQRVLEDCGGELIEVDSSGRFEWDVILRELKLRGTNSVMIEGGASIINELLTKPSTIDSLIVTIGGTYLGSEGVEVSPPATVRLADITWTHGPQDAVMCSRLEPL